MCVCVCVFVCACGCLQSCSPKVLFFASGHAFFPMTSGFVNRMFRQTRLLHIGFSWFSSSLRLLSVSALNSFVWSVWHTPEVSLTLLSYPSIITSFGQPKKGSVQVNPEVEQTHLIEERHVCHPGSHSNVSQ